MVVDVIRCQRRGDNLVQILSIPATDDEVSALRFLCSSPNQADEYKYFLVKYPDLLLIYKEAKLVLYI